MKSFGIILLINIVIVTLSTTSALGWVTVKNGTFVGMFEGKNNRERTADSVLLDEPVSGSTVEVYAMGKNDGWRSGEASVNYVFDTAVPGNEYEYSGKSDEIYQSYVTYNLKATLSGSNKYIKVTVRLYYNDALGLQVLAESSRTHTKTIDSRTSYIVYSGPGELNSNRGLYVEVTIRVYARSVWGQATSIVDMSGVESLTLTGWGIQRYYSPSIN